MKYKIFLAYVLLFLALLTGCTGMNETEKADEIENGDDETKWVAAWSASMQAPFKEGISQQGFENKTIRMIVHPHIDGNEMRIQLSNAFSKDPLSIEKVQVAAANEGAETVPGTAKQISFKGDQQVTIPPGEVVYSDPIPFKVKNGENLAVSLFVKDDTGPVTWHPRSMQTTYISDGNHVSDTSASSFDKEEEAWFWLGGIDVTTDTSVKGSLVVVGSSIANGNHSTLNANHRWPDYLAKRMNKKKSKVKLSVLNAGISANQLLNSPPKKGEKTMARLEQDVFTQTGVKGVILHQGLNDIRHHPDIGANKIIEEMKKIIEAAHDEGLKIYGGTLTPFKGSGLYTEKGEKTRQEVNEWIRTSKAFDGVIDFDKALRNPENPARYLPKYDAGDHLHPNDAGYKKMAETIDLSMFE
ncbi:SGNH/GDSL hydrolase family protein [Thalassobacillus pellis]|uniref:SGNH/GDSL hydrolase family protein n=1 Tax=Thalassobacillus pellis TaxID=748008 RepID=UPI00195F8C9E|nr:SGNH/GDSL hydrolase family protein [Thalassobacillus pellis]MBM7553321.1 lysophospholipase L1-like esterase [Thalassobacillus pellis]